MNQKHWSLALSALLVFTALLLMALFTQPAFLEESVAYVCGSSNLCYYQDFPTLKYLLMTLVAIALCVTTGLMALESKGQVSLVEKSKNEWENEKPKRKRKREELITDDGEIVDVLIENDGSVLSVEDLTRE